MDSGLNVPQLLLAATLDSTLSIEDIDSEPVVLALNVYPNPFVDNISIDFSNYDGQNAVLVELINFSGVTIMSKEAFGQKIELSDLALPTGVYILKVTHNGKTSIKKMIKVD